MMATLGDVGLCYIVAGSTILVWHDHPELDFTKSKHFARTLMRTKYVRPKTEILHNLLLIRIYKDNYVNALEELEATLCKFPIYSFI